MSQGLLQSHQNIKFESIFTTRFIVGYAPNRTPFHAPIQSLYSDFYKMGLVDTLADGLNTELTVRQSIARRPGNPAFSSADTAAAIDSFYSFSRPSNGIQVIADSLTDVEVLTPTTATSIFTKATGAGEGYFAGVNQSLYIADGIDLVKYIPGTLNPTTGQPVWNWGGVAPTTAPSFTIVETGSAGVPWQAVTVFTTMGLLVDSNGNVEQLISVNNSGSNTTQFGTTGNGQPAWNAALGGTTSDNTVTWTNRGPVGLWTPSTTYDNFSNGGTTANPCVIYDPGTGALYGNSNAGGATGVSGTQRPNFTGVNGSVIHDGSVKWFCIGPAPSVWAPSHAYTLIGSVSNNDQNCSIVEPIALSATYNPSTQPTTWQAVTTAGTSGTGGTAPRWALVAGQETQDNDLVWVNLGTATRAINTAYTAWGGQGQLVFSVIKDSNNNFQVCTTSGISSGTATGSITWATVYGSTTVDGTVTWTCVGSSLSWAASTIWYLPATGFAPPSPSQPYGGATIADSNSVNQFVVNSGKSKSGSHPSWSAIGANTSDGTVTWFAESDFSAVGFEWQTGYGYCVAFKARTATDAYVLTAPPLQLPDTNSPNTVGPLGPPTGCGDGTVTTASPVIQIVGGNVGAQIILSGLGSIDPQFDTVSIFRSTDGFGAGGPYLFLTDIPMPAPINGKPGTWSIIDFMPDLATADLPGLNPLFEAPIGNANDPPPGQFGSTQFVQSSAATPTIPAAGSAMIGVTEHQGRLWGFIGNSVFASGGPDTNPGNGFTAWPPDQEFPFPSTVIKLLSTPAGLLVFTTTDVGGMFGGPSIESYYSQIVVPGVGILSPNCVTQIAGTPYVYSSDRQIIGLNSGTGITLVAHNIANKLATDFDPAESYLTFHSYGDADHCLFIGDGEGSWYRGDINPTPDGQYTGPVWSPKATISGGFQAIQSIETSPGTKQLLIGPASAGKVLARDSTFSTFADNGSAYSSWFVVGNVTLAAPGFMAQLGFLEADFNGIGSLPTVSWMGDETSPTNGASFTTISDRYVSDPPKLYGPASKGEGSMPSTIYANRYYFDQVNQGGVPPPSLCRSLQIRFDFGNTDQVQNEIYTFALWGALWESSSKG